MARKVEKRWYSEKELSELFWEGALKSATVCNGELYGTIYREPEIAHGLRPDYLFFRKEDGSHRYDIIELKIHADAESVAQICNYLSIFDRHVRNARSSAFPTGLRFQFIGHLIARTFDRTVYSLAEQAGVRLWRMKPSPCGLALGVEEECHPFETVELVPWFLEMLKTGDPHETEGTKFQFMSMIEKEPDNG